MEGQDTDIFKDLLQGEHRMSKQNELGKLPTPKSQVAFHLDNDNFESLLEPCLNLRMPQNIDKSILSRLNAKNLNILTFCQDENFCYILLDTGTSNFVKIQVYRRPKSISSDASSTSSPQPQLFHAFHTNLASSLFQDENYQGSQKSSLFVIHQDTSPVDSTQAEKTPAYKESDSGNINLSQTLFTYLFGHDIACMNSPVLILACNNGDVFSYIMESQHHGQLHLFCNVSESVASILKILLADEISECDEDKTRNKIMDALQGSAGSNFRNAPSRRGTPSQALLVLGSTGECCLFLQPPNPGITVPVIFLLQDPLVSCISIGKSIIYSTGSSIKTCQLAVCKRGAHISISHKISTLLSSARIRSLHLHYNDEREECHLIGITNDYDMVTLSSLHKSTSSPAHSWNVDIPTDSEDAVNSRPSCLKDTFFRLNEYSTAMNDLEEQSKHIDSLLLQLNLFATISQQKNTAPSGQELNFHWGEFSENFSPDVVECHCELLSPVTERPDCWKLKMRVVNHSVVPLSDAWSLMVTEKFTMSHSQRVNAPNVNTFQIRLNRGLAAKSEIVFYIPIIESSSLDHFQILQISVSLILCLESPQQDKNGFRIENGTRKLLHVEIYRCSFDLFHFLQPSSSVQFMEKTVNDNPTQGWLHEQLWKMALERAGRCRAISMNSNVKSQSFTLNVDLPSNICENISKSSESSKSFLEPHPCRAIGTSLSLLSPNSHPLFLTLDVSDKKEKFIDCDGYGINRYSLKLKCNDSMLLFAATQALMKRLQNKSSNGKNVLSRQKLEKSIHILKDIHHSMLKEFNVVKFGTSSSPDYLKAFSHLLQAMVRATLVEQEAT